MSTGSPVTEPFVADVVASLVASGIYCFVDHEVGPTSICLELVRGEVLCWVDVADATHAISQDRSERLRLIVNGPLGPDVEACGSASWVAAKVVAWVLAQRAERWR
jgi:hypothetical protein